MIRQFLGIMALAGCNRGLHANLIGVLMHDCPLGAGPDESDGQPKNMHLCLLVCQTGPFGALVSQGETKKAGTGCTVGPTHLLPSGDNVTAFRKWDVCVGHCRDAVYKQLTGYWRRQRLHRRPSQRVKEWEIENTRPFLFSLSLSTRADSC